MSYAIIRNAKYKMSNALSISKHNERLNKKYGNKDIDPERIGLNYHLKEPEEKSYEKEFYKIRENHNLKGNLRLTGKKQSNVICEFLITSDKEFFDKIGEDETKRYFEEAFEFAKNKVGEKNIISAVVHMDEKTPHMHLTYIPVVKDKNKKGEIVEKINCSKFWQGYNSYGILQDKFFEHVKSKGFDLERGEKSDREHIEITKFKQQTLQKELQEIESELKVALADKKIIETIDNIKTEKTLLGKKVKIDVDEFEELKEASKQAIRLEKENKELKVELYEKNKEIESIKVGLKRYMDVVALNEELKKKVRGLEFQLERIFSVVKDVLTEKSLKPLILEINGRFKDSQYQEQSGIKNKER